MTREQKICIFGGISTGFAFILSIYLFVAWSIYILKQWNEDFVIKGFNLEVIDIIILTWILVWLWGVSIYYNYIGKLARKIKKRYCKTVINTHKKQNEKKYQRGYQLERYT